MKLVLDGVTVGYGGDPAVRGATLAVADGEFVALVGANGSGKSTLLKTLYRALRPWSGTVALGEDDLWRIPHRSVARAVGVLGQDADGGFDFTARETVALGRSPHLGPFDRPGRDDADIVDDALARTGCAHLADRPLSTMSGGERQRVLIARALAQQPRVMVLDEPTNHLDPQHQIAALRLVASLDVTVLAALHSLDLAAQYADTAIVLSGGRIVAAGAPAEVFVPAVLRAHFGVDGELQTDRVTGRPRLLLRELDGAGP